MAKKDVIMIDPSLEYERMLSYKEKESMWMIYKTLFWGIYMLAVAILLIKYVPNGLSLTMFFGWSTILLALFTIVYGISVTLHLKLMKRYG
jgi:FtsH-binding integral membrane protein